MQGVLVYKGGSTSMADGPGEGERGGSGVLSGLGSMGVAKAYSCWELNSDREVPGQTLALSAPKPQPRVLREQEAAVRGIAGAGAVLRMLRFTSGA